MEAKTFPINSPSPGSHVPVGVSMVSDQNEASFTSENVTKYIHLGGKIQSLCVHKMGGYAEDRAGGGGSREDSTLCVFGAEGTSEQG